MRIPKGWKKGLIYRLGDRLPFDHPLRPQQKIGHLMSYWQPPSNGQWVGAEWRGERRKPKKGEFYLSGCEGFVKAYLASNDLTTEYFIAIPVLVKNVTKTISTILNDH